MSDRVDISGLSVDRALYDLVEEISAGTGVEAPSFWQSLAHIVAELGPQNSDLLQQRDQLQTKIDDWHKANPGPVQRDPYQAFLREIGYLVPEPDPFKVTTENVDDEIALIAGPQLVVPVDNARYALNAANARWGSLFDALYGTDVIAEDGGAEKGSGYNPKRGERVFAFTAAFLDEAVPLSEGTHADVTAYGLDGSGPLALVTGLQLRNRITKVG